MANTPQVRQMVIEQQGAQNFPHTAEWVDAIVLAANTEQKYDFTAALASANGGKAKALFVVFSADGPFYVDFNGNTAAKPVASTVNGAAPEYSPNQRYIDSVALGANSNKISLIATSNTVVVMQVYSV